MISSSVFKKNDLKLSSYKLPGIGIYSKAWYGNFENVPIIVSCHQSLFQRQFDSKY